jgi:hypothetical protein
MSRKSSGPLPAALAVGIVTVAALATLMTQDGWMLWPPVLAALAVAAGIQNRMFR